MEVSGAVGVCWCAAAARLFAELVEDRLRIFGRQQPTRTVGSSLQHARFLAAAGDPRRAATILAETRRRCADVVSVEHPLSRFAARLLETIPR